MLLAGHVTMFSCPEPKGPQLEQEHFNVLQTLLCRRPVWGHVLHCVTSQLVLQPEQLKIYKRYLFGMVSRLCLTVDFVNREVCLL